MKKVNLTISENYVSNWGFWEAMREILQNAIDSEGMTVQKKESSGSIVINNDGALSLSTLMLGESSKRNDSESIGKYGEGYKLALLVLCRAGYNVSVKTGFEIWTPTIEQHPQLGVNSLCINIQEADCEHKGVEFSVFNLSGDDFTALDEKFICSESVEVVASAGGSYCFEEWDEENKRLFVGGLFVCDLGEDYKYSWSFAPNILELDRDRSSANGFHVDLEATKMLASAGEYELIANLAKSGCQDVSAYYQSCGETIETKDEDNRSIRDFATDNFINEYGVNAYPLNAADVSSKNQIITKKCISLGLEPVVIPSQFYVLLSKELKKELSHNGKKINKVSDAILDFLESNKKHMRSRARKEMMILIDDLILQEK